MTDTLTAAATSPRRLDPFRHLLAHLEAFDAGVLATEPPVPADRRALLDVLGRFRHALLDHRCTLACQRPAAHHHLPPPPPPTSLHHVLTAFLTAAPFLDHLCPLLVSYRLHQALTRHVQRLLDALDPHADADPPVHALLAALRALAPSVHEPPIDVTRLDLWQALEGYTLATELQGRFLAALVVLEPFESLSLDPPPAPRRSALFRRLASTSCDDLARLPRHELRALTPILDSLHAAAQLALDQEGADDDVPRSPTASITHVLHHVRACLPHTIDLRDQDLALLHVASDLLWALHHRVTDAHAARHLADPDGHGLTDDERTWIGPLDLPPPLAELVGLLHQALTLARGPVTPEQLAPCYAAAAADLSADELRDLAPVLRDLHAAALAALDPDGPGGAPGRPQ